MYIFTIDEKISFILLAWKNNLLKNNKKIDNAIYALKIYKEKYNVKDEDIEYLFDKVIKYLKNK